MEPTNGLKQLRRAARYLILICTVGVFSSFQNSEPYQKTKDGVVFTIGRAKLKITVRDASIMQVNYTFLDTFPTKRSLIIEDKIWPETPFSVTEENGVAIISTQKMKAKVNITTGQVSFYDANDKVLLREKKNGKSIVSVDYQGVKTNEIRDSFESSPSEAIYGLGQHQDRLLNINGYDLDLFQHNTEVYVPFFVSTNGYGLLWHNYSHTKFNDPDAIQSISKDQLFNDKGEQGSLTAKIYSDTDFKNLMPIDTNQLATTLSIGTDSLIKSAMLTGSLKAETTGEHLFYSYADGGFKLYVNDSLVLDNWAPYANARDMGKINLEQGKKYKIKVLWSRFHPKNSFQLKMREPREIEDVSLWSQAGQEIDYYVFAGDSMDEIISGYREATGQAPMLPKNAMGFWQSRERYKTQQELLDVVKEFRSRKIPLDIIVQDWQYWKEGEWGSELFDPKRFPDVTGMLDTLHDELHTKFMISVWGKFYPGTENFKKLNENNFLYQNPLKDTLRDFLDNRYTYYDAFNPGARKMYWDQMNKKLFSKGVDAWWLDASEPELPDYGPTPALMAKYMNPTFEGPGVENLNAFPLMTNKAVYEGQRGTTSSKRVNILTRSAFAGQQRYATTVWSGDISGEWSTLKASIPAGLSLGLSGIPYWTTDIGGFWVRFTEGNQNEEYRELFTRWYQFGVFCPVFRAHGSNTEREMWYFGDEDSEIYQSQLKFNKLRYRLMPYIYSVAGMVTQENYTIMRGLVMDFQEDEKVLDIQDQYMFGPSILVNPVTEYQAKTRQVYLPKTTGWYDFWTGAFYTGGQTIEAATPLGSMPLYVKAGAIIPFGPDLQYATEKPADPIELRVFTGADGTFTLYEDENDNYNYEDGAFSSIRFNWDENVQSLTIDKREGSFAGMLKERTFNIVFIDQQHSASEPFKISETIVYRGEKTVIQK